MSDFWDCWCGHTAVFHGDGRCRLCVGSLLRADHRMRTFADLPSRWRDDRPLDALGAQLARGHIRLQVMS